MLQRTLIRRDSDVQTGPSRVAAGRLLSALTVGAVSVGSNYGMPPRGGGVSVGEGCGGGGPSFPFYPQQMSGQASMPLICAPPGEKETALGIPVTTIADGDTVDIPITAPNLFQGNCLTIPSDIVASGLFIDDLKVGARSQILSGPLPARLFSEVSQSRCRYIKMDPATPGQPIVLRVTNSTGAPVDFQGAIEGRTLNC